MTYTKNGTGIALHTWDKRLPKIKAFFV